MQRREFLRVVVPMSLAPKLLLGQQPGSAPPPPAPVPWTLGLNPATPLPETVVADEIGLTELHFFSAVQHSTLRQLAAGLLPPLDGKPGALQAAAPEFLDFLIGVSSTNRKQVYQTGLDWLETQAQTQHQRSFATLNEAEVGSLIQPWLRTWMTDHPPTEPHADFINIAHADIRTATINSRLWSEAPAKGAQDKTPVELFWQPIEPDIAWDRVPRPSPAAVAAPKSEHSIPAYPR